MDAAVGHEYEDFTGLGRGYVEQAIAPVGTLVPLPANLSAVDAVALGSSGVVAHFGLRHAHLAPGESVLVRGAAGSIGIMAVQLAARGGAGAVAVTTSSAERGARLRELGATHLLDRAGDGGQDAMSCATFSASTVPEAERRAVTAELFAAASRGAPHAVVHEVLPLEQAVLAHQKLAAGEVLGRTVLAPSATTAPRH